MIQAAAIATHCTARSPDQLAGGGLPGALEWDRCWGQRPAKHPRRESVFPGLIPNDARAGRSVWLRGSSASRSNLITNRLLGLPHGRDGWACCCSTARPYETLSFA